jgi:hypothetical protein
MLCNFHRGRLIGQGTVAELAGRYGFGTNRLEIVVDSDSADDDDKIRSILDAIDGVLSVERGIQGVMDASDASGDLDVPTRPEETTRVADQLGAMRRAWVVAVDPARENEVARAIVDGLVANKVGIEHFSRLTASLQQIYRVAVERSGAKGAVA